MRKQLLLISGAIGALAMSAGFAQAATDTESSGGAVDMSGILITAEKRDASLQDTPIAVTAVTSETRDLLGIITIQDITNFTPGLSYSTGLDRSSLRGLGRFTNNQGSEGAVAIYSDGVYTSSTFEAGKAPIFVERTEVLRGPQGTYYGRNSIGGTINIISRRPTDDWYAEVRAVVANYQYTDFSAAISGPITDWLRFRIAGEKLDQRDGYFTNTSALGNASEGNVRDQYYVEGQLEFNIGEAFEGWFKFASMEWENDNGGPGQRGAYSLAPWNTTVIGATNIATSSIFPNPIFGYIGANPSLTDPRLYQANTAGRITMDDAKIFAGELIWHASGFDVKYVGGFDSYIYNLTTDVDDTAATGSYAYPGSATQGAGTQVFRTVTNLYTEDKQWTSHEINIISTGDGNLQWVVGAYLYHESNNYTRLDVRVPEQTQLANPASSYAFCAAAPVDTNADGILDFFPAVTSPILGGAAVNVPACNGNTFANVNVVAAAPNPLRRYFYNHFDGTGDSWAGFAQVDWQATDTLKFTAGVRYTHDEKLVVEQARAICFLQTLCSFTAPFVGPAISYDASGNPVAASLLGMSYTSTDPAILVQSHVNAAGNVERTLSDSWSAVTGTLGLDWTPNDDTLIYAKYTRGYKAGGFNAGSIAADPSTDPEFVNAYEIGLKRNWGRVFQMNASVFYYDYLNAQAPLLVSTAGGDRTDFLNIPKSRSVGFELETVWSPIQNLQILFNYALLDAKITESGCFVDPNDPTALQPDATPYAVSTPTCPVTVSSRPQNLAGNRLPSSPLNRFTLNVNYRFEFDAGSLTTSATWVYRANTYYSIFNRFYNEAPDYTQTDFRATWTDTDNKYSIIAYLRNAFNEEGYDGAASSLYSASPGVTAFSRTLTLTPPRTYGVEFQYRFF